MDKEKMRKIYEAVQTDEFKDFKGLLFEIIGDYGKIESIDVNGKTEEEIGKEIRIRKEVKGIIELWFGKIDMVIDKMRFDNENENNDEPPIYVKTENKDEDDDE